MCHTQVSHLHAAILLYGTVLGSCTVKQEPAGSCHNYLVGLHCHHPEQWRVLGTSLISTSLAPDAPPHQAGVAVGLHTTGRLLVSTQGPPIHKHGCRRHESGPSMVLG